jgi:MFS family permease
MSAPTLGTSTKPILAVVGFLAAVEFASGVLQGFYTPIFTDIARHLAISDADINWFEAAQLVVSALCIPLLARLADLWGHRNVLLLSTVVTAVGSWVLAFAPSFSTFLVGWAIQGAYVIWLPIEVALVYRRTAGTGRQGVLTRRAAGILVGVLELSVIVAALSAGALVGTMSMNALLAIPAVVVTICFFVIWFGITDTPPEATGRVDWVGFVLITAALGAVMGGLIEIRLAGLGSPLVWGLLVVGAALLAVFVRYESTHHDPLVDVAIFRIPGQWPVQITAFLFGMSVLGAQIPLSTFARTDPAVVGYGLGASAGFVSTLIGVYVISMAIGAFTFPVLARVAGMRGALSLSLVLVAIGYALWLPFHDTTTQALVNMLVVGIGSGALVAALPAAAAASAPADRTGLATGLTNGVKTVGGAIASSVFAIALASTGSLEGPAANHAPMSGYLTVWAICSASSLLAAVLLHLVPKIAYADPDEVEVEIA